MRPMSLRALVLVFTATVGVLLAPAPHEIGRCGFAFGSVAEPLAVAIHVALAMDGLAALPRMPDGQGSHMSTVTSFSEAFDAAAHRNDAREAVRLVRDGEPVTDEAAAIAAIRKHIEDNGVAIDRLAKVLDVRPGVVQTMFDEPSTIPPGPRHTLIRDASRWCQADASARKLRRARFVHTAVTRLILGLSRLVRETHTVGLIAGGPGLGKSHALHVVAAELPGETLIVRCDTDSRSAKGILRAVGLAGAATLPGARPSVQLGIEAARNGNGLVIVDEAQLLGANGLEAVRAVFDRSEVGLVLVGTTALQRTLNGQADPLSGPLVSRIALRVDLDRELLSDGRQWIDTATLREVLRRAGVDALDNDAAAALLKIANQHPAHLRAAVDTAKVARVLTRNRQGGNGEISGADVSAALRMRMVEHG